MQLFETFLEHKRKIQEEEKIAQKKTQTNGKYTVLHTGAINNPPL